MISHLMNENEFLLTLGKRIEFIRKSKSMTLIQLSYKCDIEKSNLIRIEKGRTNPTALTIFKLSTALEIEPIEFFKF